MTPYGRNSRQMWHNDNSHLIPMPSVGSSFPTQSKVLIFYVKRGRGRGGGFRGRGRGGRGGRGQSFGQYQAFHYRSKNPRQQAPVEHYFKTDMLDDPWKDCTPVQVPNKSSDLFLIKIFTYMIFMSYKTMDMIQVSEVTKQQAQNTRHRYRLFARLNQDVDRDGMDEREDDVIGPDGKRIKLEGETKEPKEIAENPDEIQIEDSSDEEIQDTKKPKKEEENEKEEEEEEEDAYDPYMDPNLDDLDDAEIQDARQMEAPYSY